MAVGRVPPTRTTSRSRASFGCKADGTGEPEVLLTGSVKRSTNTWSYFIREPSISPDGTMAAIVTDGPDPTKSDIVVKILDLADGSLSDPKLAESQSLGHQDPAWSPDGKRLLYVRNAREGARGTPAIYLYNVATREVEGAHRARATRRPRGLAMGGSSPQPRRATSGRTS